MFSSIAYFFAVTSVRHQGPRILCACHSSIVGWRWPTTLLPMLYAAIAAGFLSMVCCCACAFVRLSVWVQQHWRLSYDDRLQRAAHAWRSPAATNIRSPCCIHRILFSRIFARALVVLEPWATDAWPAVQTCCGLVCAKCLSHYDILYVFSCCSGSKKKLVFQTWRLEMETVVCLLLIGCLVNIFNRLLLREKISFAEIYIYIYYDIVWVLFWLAEKYIK